MTFLLREIWDLIKTIVLTLIIFLLINIFLVQVYRVDGASMNPTLQSDDLAVVAKYAESFDYGDVVIVDSRIDHVRTVVDDVVENPIILLLSGEMQNKKHDIWIKRIVGLEGDTIEIIDNQLYRNGQLVLEPYILEKMSDSDYHIYYVDQNSVFVMGDNRNNSKDSRFIGCIPVGNVLGKVIYPEI